MIAVFIKLHPRNATTSAADRDMPEIQDIPGERLPLNFFPPCRCSALFWICVTYLTYLLHVAYSKRGSILPLLSWFGGASANAGEPFGMVICARLGLTSARNCIVCIQLTMPCCTHSWLPHPSMYDLLLVFITLLRPTLSWNCTMDTNLLRWILLWSTRLRQTVAVFGSPKREQWQKTSKIWKD
jgi:hypothetical protein